LYYSITRVCNRVRRIISPFQKYIISRTAEMLQTCNYNSSYLAIQPQPADVKDRTTLVVILEIGIHKLKLWLLPLDPRSLNIS
jgi:hypothetical protein